MYCFLDFMIHFLLNSGFIGHLKYNTPLSALFPLNGFENLEFEQPRAEQLA